MMVNEVVTYDGGTHDAPNLGNINNIEGVWSTVDNGSLQIYKVGSMNERSACMVFDLDYTLIAPKSGFKYPLDINDWRFTSPTIVPRLRQVSEMYGIVIISNLCTYHETFRKKIENIVAQIGVRPVTVILSTKRDHNCKPHLGILRYLNCRPSGIVGDCAGRAGDFSDSDVRFAMYANIPFYTPEQFFGYIDYPKPLLRNFQDHHHHNRGGCCRF